MQPKLRICMAAGHFLPQIGGVERYVYSLSRAMIGIGDDVCVVTAQPRDTSTHETLDDIDVFRLPSWLLASGRLPIPAPFSPAVSAQLLNIKGWQPDLFVIHTHLFLSNLRIAGLARRLGAPCVLINHGSGYVSGGGLLVDAGLKQYERFLAERIGRRIHAAFGVSRSAAEWLGEFGLSAEGIIANGVDVASLPERSLGYREKIDAPADACLIAYAARLLPEKGADTLLSAFLALDPPNTLLAIGGDGPALAELRRQAGGHPRVRLLGALPHAEVLQLFGAADIMAYPSRYPEGQPTTVLEAGAMGCAVIATPRGGTAELIDSETFGRIVETPAQLIDSLRQLILDRALREGMARSLQARVRLEHDWRGIAQKAHNRFADLIQSQGTRESRS